MYASFFFLLRGVCKLRDATSRMVQPFVDLTVDHVFMKKAHIVL